MLVKLLGDSLHVAVPVHQRLGRTHELGTVLVVIAGQHRAVQLARTHEQAVVARGASECRQVQARPTRQLLAVALRTRGCGKRLADSQVAIAQVHRLAHAAVQAAFHRGHGDAAALGGRPLLIAGRAVGYERQDMIAVAARAGRLDGRASVLHRRQPRGYRVEHGVERARIPRAKREREALQLRARGAHERAQPGAHFIAVVRGQKLVKGLAFVQLVAVALQQIERLVRHRLVVGAVVQVQRHPARRAFLAHGVADGRLVHRFDGDGGHVAAQHGQQRLLRHRGVAVREPEVRQDELARHVHAVLVVVGRAVEDAHVAHLAPFRSLAGSDQLHVLERRQCDDVRNGNQQPLRFPAFEKRSSKKMRYGTHDTVSRGARSDGRPRLTRITREPYPRTT